MYEEFYGLTERPFQTNPNPALYFGSREHKRAMSFLEYGLHRNEGFIVITGEVGAGKTTVLRSLIGKLDSKKFIVANLVSTQLDAENALRLVASAFGIKTTSQTKADVIISLESFFLHAYEQGQRCLLIIDEAQNLSMQAVEELRMLSNYQCDTNALLQSFLVGQPEFRQTLQSPSMTQLRQRVTGACHIGPLDSSDTEAYIKHRLTLCGWIDSPNLEDAFATIYECTKGIPRRINALCDRLLLHGFLGNTKIFTESDVREVFQEMEGETITAIQPSLQTNDVSKLPGTPLPLLNGGIHGETLLVAQEDLLLRFSQIEQRLQRVEGALDGLLSNNSKTLGLLTQIAAAMENKASSLKVQKQKKIESRQQDK
jgi:putative secretion ATPase (PEP-CTERM system associated)